MPVISYRPEVDGLRAVAVVPVVLFHAGITTLSGGFIGVDVFFVISGYLITSIILSEIVKNDFSILKFYERRLRRIWPALALVIAATLAASVTIALPSQAAEVSSSGIAAIFSVANIHFWMQSGYFAPASELMPLLHTWSLGVEEQFYLVFPVILVLLTRRKLPVGNILLFSLIPLFAFSVWFSHRSPSAAFYLLPARGWELALGAALATDALPKVKTLLLRNLLSTLGLILIAAGVFTLNSGTLFPGWAAAIPCVGAGLIIHCADKQTLVGRALSLPIFVAIGLISYSLYLWHWPPEFDTKRPFRVFSDR